MYRNVVVMMLFCFVPCTGRAAVTVADIFGDNMVLQRDMKVPVWGRASPGEEVTVSFLGQKKTVKADGKGIWQIKLDALKAGGPFELTVAGKNKITFKNVLVGEVWICSGQSNMAQTMHGIGKDAAGVRQPLLRLNGGRWQESSPETARSFSATGYYFAHDLQKALGVPVGIINRSKGGTSARLWTSMAAAQADPAMKPFLGKRRGGFGGMYESKIRPLIPYAIRGVIWYQGEADGARSEEYRHLFKTLITSWRADWGQGDFPFLFAHLGAKGGPPQSPADVGWGLIREAQSAALALPNTAVAAFHDSDPALHPLRKELVAGRLALAARGVVYGEKIVYSGPRFDSLKIEGDKAILSFQHVGGGLVARGGALKGFAIAGADGKFVWAEAKITGDKVTVWSKEVPKPVHVRYGFASNPQCNLANREGLPALPFRTDGRGK